MTPEQQEIIDEPYVDETMSEEEQELINLKIRAVKGEKLTPDEYAKVMGLDKIPKFKKGKRTYQLRKMFGQLTRHEQNQEVKEAKKAAKVERGMTKIYDLLARAGI